MSGTTSRTLRLLELLQASHMRTLRELAARLEVDERTVRRYVEKLRDLDIPIESVRGRYGGYRLTEGAHVPPLMLSDEEAVAVTVCLLHARARADSQTPTAEGTALAKIQRSLPASAARSVDALLTTAAVGPSAEAERPEPGILLTIADAVRARRPLDIRYRDAAGEPSHRTLHPSDLITRAGRWYVVGLDVARGAKRTLRVDRIRSARALAGEFAASTRNTDAVDDLVEGFARAEYRWHVILRIRARTDQIRAHLPESVAILTPLDEEGTDGPASHAEPWVRAELRAERLEWLPPVIAAIEGETVIDAPDELRELVREAAGRLIAAASPTEARRSPLRPARSRGR